MYPVYLGREEKSSFFKAVLVTGARQVGKTTMLKHLAEGQGRTYVSMDNMMARILAKEDPVLFFQTYKPPVIIDEIQKAPELFEQIKRICDESEERGLFWLTGSNFAYAPAKANLTYYRDSNAKEIDVFVEGNGIIHPLEIKKSANPDRREVRKYELLDKAGLARGCAVFRIRMLYGNLIYTGCHAAQTTSVT